MRNSSKGFGLVEALVATLIVSIVLLLGFSIFFQLQRLQAQSQILMESALLRRNVIAILKDPQAWSLTANANDILECLRTDEGDCTTAAAADDSARTFNLYDNSGTAFFLAPNETSGISLSGTACTTYNSDPDLGSIACPFRPIFTFRPLCQTGVPTCVRPAVEILVNLQPSFGKELRAVNTGLSSPMLIVRPARDDQELSDVRSEVAAQGNWSVSGSIMAVPVLSATNAPESLTVTNNGGFVSTNSYNYRFDIAPKTDQLLSFQKETVQGDASPENQSEVCLMVVGATTVCEFKWVQDRGAYYLAQLNSSGSFVRVYPDGGGTVPIVSGRIYQFRVSHGKVSFFEQGGMVWFFTKPLLKKYRYRIIPAGRSGPFIGSGIKILQ